MTRTHLLALVVCNVMCGIIIPRASHWVISPEESRTTSEDLVQRSTNKEQKLCVDSAKESNLQNANASFWVILSSNDFCTGNCTYTKVAYFQNLDHCKGPPYLPYVLPQWTPSMNMPNGSSEIEGSIAQIKIRPIH